MPNYAHKNGLNVTALKIASVEMLADGAKLIPESDKFKPITVDVNFVIVNKPKSNGYFIQYENGARSYMDAAKFEENYTEAK